MDALNDLFGGVATPASKPLPCLPSIGHYPARKRAFPIAPLPKAGPLHVRVVDPFAGDAGPYWLDMETGVRDQNDRFDLWKVRAVCELVYGARR